MRTARLLLRRWRETDHAPFAALNADPMVREYFPSRLTQAESDDLVAKIEAGFETRGYGLWALEVRASGEFVGFTGLAVPSFKAHFTPAVEVGWRLARSAWGQGYATEAGLASVAFGFRDVGLDEIVSFTSAANARSRAVMQSIGMTHNPDDDFDHPELEETDILRPHVLYQISAADWLADSCTRGQASVPARTPLAPALDVQTSSAPLSGHTLASSRKPEGLVPAPR